MTVSPQSLPTPKGQSDAAGRVSVPPVPAGGVNSFSRCGPEVAASTNLRGIADGREVGLTRAGLRRPLNPLVRAQCLIAGGQVEALEAGIKPGPRKTLSPSGPFHSSAAALVTSSDPARRPEGLWSVPGKDRTAASTIERIGHGLAGIRQQVIGPRQFRHVEFQHGGNFAVSRRPGAHAVGGFLVEGVKGRHEVPAGRCNAPGRPEQIKDHHVRFVGQEAPLSCDLRNRMEAFRGLRIFVRDLRTVGGAQDDADLRR